MLAYSLWVDEAIDDADREIWRDRGQADRNGGDLDRLDGSGSVARNAKSLANFLCQFRADAVTDLSALAASSAALRA